MGLAIARTIVDAHGGRLVAANSNQSGATVRFALPVGRKDVIFITAHDDAWTRGHIEQSGAAGHLWKPLDEAELLDAIRRAIGLGDDPGERTGRP